MAPHRDALMWMGSFLCRQRPCGPGAQIPVRSRNSVHARHVVRSVLCIEAAEVTEPIPVERFGRVPGEIHQQRGCADAIFGRSQAGTVEQRSLHAGGRMIPGEVQRAVFDRLHDIIFEIRHPLRGRIEKVFFENVLPNCGIAMGRRLFHGVVGGYRGQSRQRFGIAPIRRRIRRDGRSGETPSPPCRRASFPPEPAGHTHRRRATSHSRSPCSRRNADTRRWGMHYSKANPMAHRISGPRSLPLCQYRDSHCSRSCFRYEDG